MSAEHAEAIGRLTKNVLVGSARLTRDFILVPGGKLAIKGSKKFDKFLDRDAPRMRRGTYVASVAFAAALGSLATSYFQRERVDPDPRIAIAEAPKRPHIELPDIPLPPVLEPKLEGEDRDKFTFPFEDKDANRIAMEHKITAGAFFKIPEETFNRMKAFLGDELYPIYPPAVFAYKDLIYKHAKETGIPPNIIAMIMTVESAGNKNAESIIGGQRGAQGLMQVMPNHFYNIGVYDFDAMKDPNLNIKMGALVFKDFLQASRNIYDDYPENHPLIYIRAVMGYNGGQQGLKGLMDKGEVEDETAFYGDHMARFMVIMDEADGLRKKGNSDSEIIQKLSSRQLAARAYALRQWDRRSRPYPYDASKGPNEVLAQRYPWESNIPSVSQAVKNQFKADTEAYLANPSLGFPFQASAGVQLWWALGGESLILSEPTNTNPQAWLNINSRKN